MVAQPRPTKIIQDQLVDYCQNTSLHGVKYLAERQRPRFERLLWLVALILSISVCAWLIQQVWLKWETSPVIMTSEMTQTPVWSVPFPAITVCSQIKTSKDIFNFTFASQNTPSLSTKMARQLHDMCLVCSVEQCNMNNITFTADEESVQFLLEAAPALENVIWISFWLDTESMFGQKVFTPILTEEGLCHTFNMLDVQELFTSDAVQSDRRYLNSSVQPDSEWTQEKGYSPTAGIDTYPERAIVGSNDQNGLTVLLTTLKQDIDYLCTQSEQGFKVYIHNPAEMPQARHHPVFLVDPNKKVAVSLLPRSTTTSDQVKRYTSQERQCFYPSEKNLRFFRVYTKANCEMECLANYTLSACDCVPFFMPRSNLTSICNVRSRINCVKDYPIIKQLSALKQEFRHRLNSRDYNEWIQKQLATLAEESIECNCFPACTSLDYTVIRSSTRDYDWKEFIGAHRGGRELLAQFLNPNDTFTLAQIDIKMSDVQYIATKRTELFGKTDFLANCGGLLGLCMGFSVLSLVELIYFSTISLCIRFQRKKSVEAIEL